MMKLAFTTLSCPDWTFDKILDEASRLGYDGIEIRGIEGEMHLPRARPFLPANVDATKCRLRELGLEICCLGTSVVFHDLKNHEGAIQEGRASIDLAQRLGVPYIRVFGDRIPDPSRRQEAIEAVAKGLGKLASHAEGTGL
jgi:sugar phosphate isomerase/epimerase